MVAVLDDVRLDNSLNVGTNVKEIKPTIQKLFEVWIKGGLGGRGKTHVGYRWTTISGA